MRDARQGPDLDWRAGEVPISRRFADPYYSIADGLGETRHVFLEGNDLPRRWQGAERFRVGELGFGTGLGFLAALALWRERAAPGAVLDFVSFEIAPMTHAQMARALAPWEALADDARALLSAWDGGGGPLGLPGARLEVVVGDARKTVPRWEGTADAWFLDGFAPARNPEMWGPDLMATVHDRTRPGGTVATYSAAGTVRRALAAAGFLVRKRPGFGRKRDMTAGVRPSAG